MIKHIKCDIFESGADVILHQVNCQGAMNSGVAKQVREKFPKVYESYKNLCDVYSENKHALLGKAQLLAIDNVRSIGNLFAQENYGYDGKCYTDYDALKECLNIVNDCFGNKTIAIPYLMGCARGGGDWNIVYKMIEEIFGDDINILICECDRG